MLGTFLQKFRALCAFRRNCVIFVFSNIFSKYFSVTCLAGLDDFKTALPGRFVVDYDKLKLFIVLHCVGHVFMQKFRALCAFYRNCVCFRWRRGYVRRACLAPAAGPNRVLNLVFFVFVPNSGVDIRIWCIASHKKKEQRFRATFEPRNLF